MYATQWKTYLMSKTKKIQVTKTYLPDLERYHTLLEEIWERSWVTNNGPLVDRLEQRLCAELGVDHLSYVSNGTIALQLALKALGVTGSVVTTPYSYVATTNAILAEHLHPIFVDIDECSFNVDPQKVEAALRPDTSALLVTHVYGYPCDHDALKEIAERHGLLLIYDAAHAYGVRHRGRALVSYGDAATLSFHATKVFHTIEGGAVVVHRPERQETVKHYRSFGHVGPTHYNAGINGKNSELHAGVGLLNFELLEKNHHARRTISERYDDLLGQSDLLDLHFSDYEDLEYNYAYYPVLFTDHGSRERAVRALNRENIFPRRYFTPSLNTLPYLSEYEPAPCPVSEDICQRVLCLPLYPDLELADVDRIAGIVLQSKRP